MATMQLAKASAASARPTMVVRTSAPRALRVSVVASAVKATASRRETLGAAIALSAAVLSNASPALAIFGFDDDAIKEKYTNETAAILAKVNGVLALERGDESKDGKVKDLRKDINSWVAAYRREPLVSGRPSYGNTYSALNALAGHYNNFGTSAPIPKKRLERLTKELNDANLFLTRGR